MSEIKKLSFKQNSNLQIEVLLLHNLRKINQNVFSIPHRTNFYHVFLFENCNPIHFIDFEPVKIEPYSLLFIDKDRVHQFDLLSKYEGKILIFTEDFFCTSENDSNYLKSTILFNNIENKPTINVNKQNFEKYITSCKNISEELNLPEDSLKPYILKNLLHNFLLLAEREKLKQGLTEIKKGTALEHTMLFRDLVEKNYKKLKNVNDYASHIFISEKRLGQATSKVLGKSPKEIINDRILLEAKRLLVHTHLSVKEIGQQLGFEDSSYFVRYFKKNANVTPIEFRSKFFK